MTPQFPVDLTCLNQFKPAPWSQIPDFGLYVDQVITYIGQVYEPICGADVKQFLSAPMINNYVKGKLIPRPTGKKYSREQIALLSMIVPLKQVCSMEEIRRMLTPANGGSVEALYGAFCARCTRAMGALPSHGVGDVDCLDLAFDLAIQAAACHAGCVAALRAANAGAQPG